MTYFLQQGSTFKVIDEADIKVTTALPVGTYVVKKPNPHTDELVLARVDDFASHGKLYGNITLRAERIVSTYLERPKSTGVLLVGEKGSGKTLLAREIAILAALQGMPTVLINNDWHGDTFNQLIQAIDNNAVIIFDEFEKTYRETPAQEAILTLLDGTFQTKKLFVFTCNNVYALNEHMLNRPGRLYYHLKFAGLEEEFIREYCADNLKDVSKTNSICSLAKLFVEFNFDMLKAIVEELNRYGEDVHEVVKMLNTKPGGGNDGEFAVTLVVAGLRTKLYNQKWHGNPLNASRTIEIYFTVGEGGPIDSDDADYYSSSAVIEDSGDDEVDDVGSPARFRIEHLQKVDAESGTYEYDNGSARLKLTRIRSSGDFNLKSAL